MASIHKRVKATGTRYLVTWRDPGSPTLRSCTVHTLDAAKRIKLRAEVLHDAGKPYAGPAAEEAAEAERRSVDLWLLSTEYLAAKRRAGWVDGSIEQADIAIGLFLAGLEERDDVPIPLERLTREALAAHYDHLRAERGCSLTTARDRVLHIYRWWQWAIEQGRWPGLGAPRKPEMARPLAHPEPVAPTWEEMDRAIACASGWYRRLMTVCRFTGLRGEDQALQLRRADLRDGWLTIRPELGKTASEQRGRVVPVSPYLLAELATWPTDPDGWLVHIPRTTTRHTGAPKRRAWNDQTSAAWERAGVRREVWDTQPTADGSRRNGHPLHAFRRGVITGLLVAGAKLADVQVLVGHKGDANVTTTRYTDPAQLRDLAAVVALIPPRGLVEVRAIQGGAVVWAGLPNDARWRRTC